MHIMRNIFQILDYIMDLKGFSKVFELAEFFGVAQNTVSSWKRRGSIPHKRIIAICAQEGWNYQTILTSETELYIDKDKIIERVFDSGKEYPDSPDPMDHIIKGFRGLFDVQKKEIEKLHETCEEILERISSLEKRAVGNAGAGSGSRAHSGDATRKKES